MSPCTVAGTLAQVLAEALASLCLVQLVNPRRPLSDGQLRQHDLDAVRSAHLRHAEAAEDDAGFRISWRARSGVPLQTVGAGLDLQACRTLSEDQEAFAGVF